MTTLNDLGQPPTQSPEYLRAYALETLKAKARVRASLSTDDERGDFDFDNHDDMVALAAQAEADVEIPVGKPSHARLQSYLDQIVELNEELRDLEDTDPVADQLKAQIEDLTVKYERLRTAAQGG